MLGLPPPASSDTLELNSVQDSSSAENVFNPKFLRNPFQRPEQLGGGGGGRGAAANIEDIYPEGQTCQTRC
jgi:hypothetical protein